jgi:hypothetical protein
MAMLTNPTIVTCEDYIAGWMDGSIHEFLGELPRTSRESKFAAITCLDSNPRPASLLKKSPELKLLGKAARPLGAGLVLPARRLLEADSQNRLFYGFDEIWFFTSKPTEPKPTSLSLVGPARIDQRRLRRICSWMSQNSCSLGLGDGDGLNFIVRIPGLLRHLLEQPAAQASSD